VTKEKGFFLSNIDSRCSKLLKGCASRFTISGRFNKTFYHLTQVTSLRAKILLKKDLLSCQVSISLNFLRHNLHCYWHIAVSFDIGYIPKNINNAEKKFMKLPPGVNFIKLLWHNLHCYWCITSSVDSSYAARGEKCFMKLQPGPNVIKLFTAAIYEFLY
jgi:hypothetical protein